MTKKEKKKEVKRLFYLLQEQKEVDGFIFGEEDVTFQSKDGKIINLQIK